jgi:hypothetical protein
MHVQQLVARISEQRQCGGIRLDELSIAAGCIDRVARILKQGTIPVFRFTKPVDELAELVLRFFRGGARAHGLAVEQGVIERERGAARVLGRSRELGNAVVVAAGGQQGDAAEHPAARAQRQNEVGTTVELLQQLYFIAAGLIQRDIVFIRLPELRRAGRQRYRLRRVRVQDEVFREPPQPRLAFFILVRGSDATNGSIVTQNVDDRGSRKVRDG